LAHFVTDRIVTALHRVGVILLLVAVGVVFGAIWLTKSPANLISAVAMGALSFGIPGLSALALAYWLEAQTEALEHTGELHVADPEEETGNPFPGPLVGYGIAVAATGFAWGFRALLNPYVPDDSPLVIWLLPIAFSGWVCGYGPAFVSTALAMVVARYFYMAPVHELLFTDATGALRLGSFLFIGLLVGGLTAALHAALYRVQYLASRLHAIETKNLT
jgi:Domain of unknown function (DUF4118)